MDKDKTNKVAVSNIVVNISIQKEVSLKLNGKNLEYLL